MTNSYPAQNGKLDPFTVVMMGIVLRDHPLEKDHGDGWCCQVATDYQRRLEAHEKIVAQESSTTEETGAPVFEPASQPQMRYIQSLARKCPPHLLSPEHRALVETVQAEHQISRQDAKGLLDAMISLVDGPNANADKKSLASTRLITPAQLGFLKKLLATRKHDLKLDLTKLADLPFTTASKHITDLKEAPFAGTSEGAKKRNVAVEPEEGLYKVGEDVYKVQRGLEGAKSLYAKIMNLETGDFHYVGQKPFHLLTADVRMTAEEAGRYGKLYGKCIRCGKRLTDEFSIANGLGKVCITKF